MKENEILISDDDISVPEEADSGAYLFQVGAFKNANDAIEFMQEQATGKSPKAFAMADPNKDFAVYSDGKGNFKAGSKQEVKAFTEKHPMKKDSTTTNTAETSLNLSPLAPPTPSISHSMVA